MSKRKEITTMLIDIFDRINIDTPNNFDNILEFVVEDVEETADKENWHDGDVAIAFRRWIELNQNKKVSIIHDCYGTYLNRNNNNIIEFYCKKYSNDTELGKAIRKFKYKQ